MIQIISYVVTPKKVTLFSSEGDIHDVPSNSPHVSKIIQDVQFQIAENGYYSYNPSDYITLNPFEEFNKLYGEESPFKLIIDKLNNISDALDSLVSIHTPDGRVIPNAEKLVPYVSRALETKNPKGFIRLVERLSSVEREHSVQDTLSFLEEADLPLTDDGGILAYKAVNYNGDKSHYVDIHSGRVKQAVGTMVMVDPSLIDLNRDSSCAAGLHIAARSYLKNFKGHTCVLVHVNPEDIYVVPHDHPEKVRVSQYYIVGEFSVEDYFALWTEAPVLSAEGTKLIAYGMGLKNVVGASTALIKGHRGTDVDYAGFNTPITQSIVRDVPVKEASFIKKPQKQAAEDLDISAIRANAKASEASWEKAKQDALDMFFSHNLSNAEIARRTGVSERTLNRLVYGS